MPNRCFPKSPNGRALAADFQPGPSKTCVLQRLNVWAIKNVVFSRVLGVMAPRGRLVTCLGRLGQQNRPQGFPFDVTFCHFFNKKRPPERDGSQVAFSLFFCGFLEGPTLDPLAPAQSKHSLPFSAWPLTGCRLYCSSGSISGTFGVDIS